jgi:dipeptidyl aminopeptidase/acylaminoacyl peptidase
MKRLIFRGPQHPGAGGADRPKARLAFRLGLGLLLVAVMATLLFQVRPSPEPAQAAFPGGNGKLLIRRYASTGTWALGTIEADATGFSALAVGFDGSWSPDGTKIVFSTSSNDIATMNADGSNFKVIVSGGNSSDPAWSPDGSRIVFNSWRDGIDISLYTADADGNNPTHITPGIRVGTPARWSPDGNRIVFLIVGVGLSSVAPDGSGLTPLTTGGTGIYPEWSPDGSKIAFAVQDGEPGIHVMNASGGADTLIASSPPYVLISGPRWSPDGSRIAYTECVNTGCTFGSGSF